MKSQIKLPVSKFDAAKRQLETAIRLWFHSGDPVSIHTLTAAAHQVLHDLSKKNGGRPSMRDASSYIKPGFEKKYLKMISEAENFFKHADRDSEATLTFKPEATPFLILDAIEVYEDLTSELVPVFKVFSSWMLLQYPEILRGEHKSKLTEHQASLDQARQNFTKAEFFAEFLPITMRYLGI